jgi:hypothetical protein
MSWHEIENEPHGPDAVANGASSDTEQSTTNLSFHRMLLEAKLRLEEYISQQQHR